MSGTVSVGLIGCGWIAELAHLPALRHSRTARLVAIADADPDRRAWARAQAPSATITADAEGLLRDPAIDAVVIALPTAAAAAVAAAAFRAGKHAYIEKPGARSADEWRHVVTAWTESGRLGMVGYNFRRNPIFVDAAHRIGAGAVGEIVAVQSRFTWAAERIEGWRASTSTGGGVLLDLASHHIDLVSRLLGDRAACTACTTRAVRVEEDAAALRVDFERGVSAQLFATSAGGANENRLTVIGSTGVLDVDLLDARPAPVRHRPGRLERGRRAWHALQSLHPARLAHSPGAESSFGRALAAFIDGVATGHSDGPDPREAGRVLAVIDAARVSAAKFGAPVPIESGPPPAHRVQSDPP